MSLKASEEDTAGAFSLLEADEPPRFGPPIHIHHNCAEAFYVLAGEYVIFIEEQEVRCPAGSFICIPSGIEHGFRVGSQPSRKLNVYIPGAMVGYFDQLSGAIVSGNADSEALDGIAADHGMEVVGPVPEGYRLKRPLLQTRPALASSRQLEHVSHWRRGAQMDAGAAPHGRTRRAVRDRRPSEFSRAVMRIRDAARFQAVHEGLPNGQSARR